MGIILKHTLRNIFGRPARTFLLVFCILICSLSALLCIDMSQSAERLISNAYSSLVGSTDIEFVGYVPLDEDYFSGLPENKSLYIGNSVMKFHKRDPLLYSFALSQQVVIVGVDLERAYEMKTLPEKLELSENETVITASLADRLGCNVGDTIYFYDDDGEKQPFVVKKFIDRRGLISNDNTSIVSPQGFNRLFSSGEAKYYTAMLDIIDDGKIDEAYELLKQTHPEADVSKIINNEEIQEFVNEISTVFAVVFAICLFVAVIITLTVSQSITSERMPTVGTLRSLGVSRTKTSLILLLENAVYALMGSIPAVIVYELIRTPLLDLMFVVEGEISPDFGSVSRLTEASVILGAVTVECLFTLKEIIKASRTAIRDIIFLNKDTEYRVSRTSAAAGLILAAAAVIAALLPACFASLMICFIAMILAVYLLSPFAAVYFSKWLEKLFAKMNMPIARLAAAQAGFKKSTVSSARLIASAASIAVLLFIFAESMYAVNNHRNIDADYIMYTDKSDYMYDYIDDVEGVTDTENIYVSMYTTAEINGKEEKNLTVFGYDDWKMFTGVDGISGAVEKDEFYMDKSAADKLGLEIGGETEIIMNSDSFLPRRLGLRLAGYCDSVCFDGRGKSIVINKDVYTDVFADHPANILIKTDGANDGKIIDTINRYSSSAMDEFQSIEQLDYEEQLESRSQNVLIKTVGTMGIFLVFIGVVGNQLIGFESRKRECAVLLSVAMGKGKLKKLLLLETVISSAAALAVSLPLGFLISLPVFGLLGIFEITLPYAANLGELLLLLAGLLIVFSLAVIFPYRRLHKMNTAQQLKYE